MLHLVGPWHPQGTPRLPIHRTPLGVRRFFDDLLPDGRKLFGGENYRGMFAALDLALVGTLEGGVDGDDPAWT